MSNHFYIYISIIIFLLFFIIYIYSTYKKPPIISKLHEEEEEENEKTSLLPMYLNTFIPKFFNNNNNKTIFKQQIGLKDFKGEIKKDNNTINVNELPKMPPKNENIPVFVQNYLTNATKDNPNYKVENITEYNFQRLYNNIQLVNREHIQLKDKVNYQFFTQSTTDDKLRMDLDMISKYVILILNNDGYYDFYKTNFGDVNLWTDKNGNEQLKFEVFLWDKKNYFEVKLLVNILKFVEKQEMTSYGIKEKKYIFQDFNIGYPFKDQIIPTPIDMIISSNTAEGTSSISPNEPAKIRFLYLNQIEVQNSTLIINYEKDKYKKNRLEVSEDGFSGITDSTLEYIKIKGGSHNPYLETGEKYNQWPTLDEEPKWKSQYPSKPPPQEWDDDGIYYYGESGEPGDQIVGPNGLNKYTESNYSSGDVKKKCKLYTPGTRWSKMQEPLQPYYWPTLATIPRNCGENFWLFDNSASVDGNTFIGGGKR